LPGKNAFDMEVLEPTEREVEESLGFYNGLKKV